MFLYYAFSKSQTLVVDLTDLNLGQFYSHAYFKTRET